MIDEFRVDLPSLESFRIGVCNRELSSSEVEELKRYSSFKDADSIGLKGTWYELLRDKIVVFWVALKSEIIAFISFIH